MRPVDTDEIQAEMTASNVGATKPTRNSRTWITHLFLEERKRELEEQIEDKREDFAEKEDEIESADADVDETHEEKRELESRLEDLRDLRADLESVQSGIDIQEESIESLQRELADLETEREGLPDTPMGDHGEIDQESSQLRERKLTLESEDSDLHDIIQFNEEMLDDEETNVTDALAAEDDSYEDMTAPPRGRNDDLLNLRERSRPQPHRGNAGHASDSQAGPDERDPRYRGRLDELRDDEHKREKEQRRRESLEDGIEELKTDIKEYALKHGPAYAHPRRVFFENDLPLTGTGKIDRQDLTSGVKEQIDGEL